MKTNSPPRYTTADGACPICDQTDGLMLCGNDVVGVCHAHRKQWRPDFIPTTERAQAALPLTESYEEVEPLHEAVWLDHDVIEAEEDFACVHASVTVSDHTTSTETVASIEAACASIVRLIRRTAANGDWPTPETLQNHGSNTTD